MNLSQKDRCIEAATDSDRQRFWEKVRKTEACWLWTGSKQKGYGNFWIQGVTARAHRVAKVWSCKGVEPNSICCHRCNNPGCVRPGHLYWGTNIDNSRDMVDLGVHRERNHRGSASVLAKLNEKQAQEIVDKYYTGGVSSYVLAQFYGVGRGAIDSILRGRNWRHCVNIPARKMLSSEKGFKKGAQSHLAKLSEAQVKEIRERKLAGETQRSLAREFGVLDTTVSAICRGLTWRHIL